MKPKNLLFFVLIFVAASCSEKQEKSESLVIDFEKNIAIKKQILMSDIASEISYIPLDSRVIVQMINSFDITEDLIFAGTFPDGLIVYDIQGNFVRKIGRKGNGPGEYSYGSAFAIDKENRKIYLLDRNKILIYNYDGHFQKEILLQEYEGDFQDIRFSDGLIYLFEYISFGIAKYDWLVINPEGEQIFAKTNKISPFKSEVGGFGGVALCNSQMYYLNGVNDTLFVADKKSVQPFAIVKWDELNKNTAGQNRGVDFNLLDMFKTQKFLFFRYYLKEAFYTACYNTNDSEPFFVISAKNINHRDGGPGIENDLDNGLSFTPKFYFKKGDDEFLCSYVYPYELKTRVTSYEFKETFPKHPEKKKELEQLANSLNENDNPVLMLAKLKE